MSFGILTHPPVPCPAMTWAQIGSFTAAAMALLLFPGPSVLFVVSRGIALGRRAALATVAGNTLGTGVHVIAVSVGVGAIVARSVAVFTAMKLAVRVGPPTSCSSASRDPRPPAPRRRSIVAANP